MRLPRILPFAALLLVAHVIVDAAPGIVAEREGGMGLGSALIGAQVVGVAGMVLGATLAAWVVDRRGGSLALLAGALLAYAGLMATGTAPMGALGWVMAALGVAGVGFGMMLTSAFSAAAAIAPGVRSLAIVLLLAAPLVARSAVTVAYVAGPIALLVAGAAVVGLAVLAARTLDVPGSGEPDAPALPAGRAVLAGTLLGAGTLAAIGGTDPTRLSSAMLAGILGIDGIEVLDAARTGMLVFGAGLLIGGTGLLLAPRVVHREVRLAAPALALLGFAASGVMSAMNLAATAGRVPEDGAVSAGIAALLGGAVGLLLAARWLRRRGEPRTVGGAGGAMLAVVAAVGIIVVAGERPGPGDMAPIALIGLAGLGIGLAAAALRLALADAPRGQRGLAAAAGVVAASIGSVLGGMVGTGQGMRLVTDPSASPVGAVALVVAALAGVALTLVLRGRSSPQ